VSQTAAAGSFRFCNALTFAFDERPKMKILFVATALPFPANIGQRVRNYSLVRAIHAEGHEISIVAFGDRQELVSARSGLADLCREVAVIGTAGTSGYIGRIGALFSELPYGAWRMRSLKMQMAVKRRLALGHFDLILCDDVYVFGNISPSPIPLILNKHTIVAEEFRRFVEHQRNPFVLTYGWSEYRRVSRLEQDACSRVNAVWACSERDRRMVWRDNPRVSVAVLPNAVDIEQYPVTDKDDGRTIIYVGAMDWFPNRDAVEFFVCNIFPEVRRLIPNARFVVAGRQPPTRFRERLERVPGIRFTGTLPDLCPQITQAAICAVPLRIGSGTRLKIIEAAAMARPVVSTTIGAEGLSLRNGKEIVIADEPKQFALEVAALLSNRPRRLEIGQAARCHVSAQYGIPALRQAVKQALEDAVHQRRPPGAVAG
jgi:polysaccharide biosynthesis protein PslH